MTAIPQTTKTETSLSDIVQHLCDLVSPIWFAEPITSVSLSPTRHVIKSCFYALIWNGLATNTASNQRMRRNFHVGVILCYRVKVQALVMRTWEMCICQNPSSRAGCVTWSVFSRVWVQLSTSSLDRVVGRIHISAEG